MELGAGSLHVLLFLSLSFLNTSAAPVLNKTMNMSYQLAAELNHSTPALLHLYLSAQGYPFVNANAPVCRVEVKCLPKGHLANMEENEMLKKIYIGAKQFDLHLKNIVAQQRNMNSLKENLHNKLEHTRNQLISLQSNLQSILHNRGDHVPRELKCSPEHINIPNNLFVQKQQGCAILREFKRYINQVLKSFHHLLRRVHGKQL
ncbi:leukemia inhibitory factor-like [Carcharodon carcharias]|uniref:leukemia inhibitory factor-like n=1 Tax=Carcharodon carcharias TaxID=13397 RepID=UPI001B7F0568|nr:leukemia inhibitory factor-like [Carcharodon carcharias]